MKNLSFAMLAILALLGGWWLGRGSTPVPPPESRASGDFQAEAKPRVEVLLPKPKVEVTAESQEASPVVIPNPPGGSFPPTPLPSLGISDDPRWREEMAASMRQSGMSEADIQNILEGLIPPEGLEEPYSPYEVTPVEASPEQLKEELKASLKDSGLPPEALDQAADGLMLQLNRQVQRPIFPRIPPVQ